MQDLGEHLTLLTTTPVRRCLGKVPECLEAVLPPATRALSHQRDEEYALLGAKGRCVEEETLALLVRLGSRS